jgi:hypothetical protein
VLIKFFHFALKSYFILRTLYILSLSVSLGIQHEICIRPFMFHSVVSLAVQYYIFPRYLTNDTIIGGKKLIEHKMRVLILSTNLSETFLILRIIQLVLL